MTRIARILAWLFIAFMIWLTWLHAESCSKLTCPDGKPARLTRYGQCVCSAVSP